MVETKPISRKTEKGTDIRIGLDAHQKSTLEEVQSGAEKVLERGELPSTEEVVDRIEKAKSTLENQKDTAEISEHGKQLLEKTRNVLDATETLIQEKNKDDKFQRIAKNVMETGRELASEEREQMRGDLASLATREELGDLLNNVRDVTMFIIRNSNFRVLLMDLADLIPDISRKIRERHGKSMKHAVKTDMDREKDVESQTMQEAQSVARELREGNLIDEKYKRELDDRFGRLLMDIGEKQSYRDAVNGIFAMIDRFQERGVKSKDTTGELMEEEHASIQRIQSDAKSLLGEFAGEDTVETFLQEYRDTYNSISEDQQMRSLLSDFRQFIVDCINYPERVHYDETKKELSELSDRLVDTYDKASDALRSHTDRMFSTGREMLDNIRTDTELKNLRQALTDLLLEATTDEKSQPDLFVMQQSLQEMRNIIVPTVKAQLHRLPLPMIEALSNSYTCRLENLSLDSAESMPEEFDLQLFSDLKLREHHANMLTTVMRLSIQGMKPKLHNFKFFYKRLAFPYLEDHGIADVNIHGHGMWIMVDWMFVKESDSAVRTVLRNVRCGIHKMDVKVLRGKHKTLDNIMLTLFRGMIKDMVQKEIEKQVGKRIIEINRSLNDVLEKHHQKTKLGHESVFEALNQGIKRSTKQFQSEESGSRDVTEMGKDVVEKVKEYGQEAKEKLSEKSSDLSSKASKIPETFERHEEPEMSAPGVGDTEERMLG